ncbi:SCO0607 family lipoprotein [Streptomyces sp. DH12]|uniref:SCO0607 family lipoprotein n=1 Tax=Streptomyces sp. DH12 TaxID=2857010 RepID=UPI001E4B8983|nr:hypothetical protein [Streptomyces sp. DH12]
MHATTRRTGGTGRARGRAAVRACLPVLAAAALTLPFLAGCAYQERVCGSDEYPVKAVGNTTGSACVPDGEQPPEGYVRYPAGQVPEHLGDEWDVYWDDRVLDGDGRVVPGTRATTTP